MVALFGPVRCETGGMSVKKRPPYTPSLWGRP
jgi:hypothetical protein